MVGISLNNRLYPTILNLLRAGWIVKVGKEAEE